ncbi:uncharacterized protein [Penaeus vannamei]|uniref:uncharacterized protein n=1 Tax=Penaeus vannamei TaxID=6689 RepID=UPI000F65CA79|nr:uncharacterized protein LOC113810163 [Penaeus vannamei]
MQLAVLLLLTACLAAGSRADDANEQREKRLYAYFSTTTSTKVTTATITDISTCLSTKTGNCNGRRKKRMAMSYIEDLEQMNDSGLDSTKQTDDLEVRFERSADDVEQADRDGRVLLTIWSTEYTSITVTSTSVLDSTTITASALCLAPNVAKTCFGG